MLLESSASASATSDIIRFNGSAKWEATYFSRIHHRRNSFRLMPGAQKSKHLHDISPVPKIPAA
jgi:hypothetical protein